MTPKIHLSDDLEVDAVEFASRANAILGIRDSGKTYTGTLIAEQLFEAGIPFFAFDPIGRWRFLRLPGLHGTGFPIVVAGGMAPDLPLTPDDAPKLIRAAMKSGVSMVIDLYDVKLSKSDWRLIVRRSIETILYEGEGHGLRHVFLEEASEFIPQRVRDGNTYAAVEKLARMGGNVGVGVTLINQRAEEVNKAVLELCDNLLLHRQRGKNSLISLGKWLNAANVKPPKEITDSIADLPTGSCWAWFKELGAPRLIKVAKKRSFDPNRREMSRSSFAKSAPASVDVSAFVARMKAALAGKPVAPVVAPVIVAPKPIKPEPKNMEGQVNEQEAQALREENKQLRERIARLEAKPVAAAYAPPIHSHEGAHPVLALNIEAVIVEIKRRALTDPALIEVIAQRPEIVVTVARPVIEMDTAKQPGLLAAMIAEGFFDKPITNAAVVVELKRRGRSVHNTNVARDLNRLAEQGFLTIEEGGYQAAPGMKVNIREAA